MPSNGITRGVRGKQSEFNFAILAVSLGWKVAVAFDPIEPYDCLIHRGNGWERIQVKSGTRRKSRPNTVGFDLRRPGGKKKKYAPDAFDWLAVMLDDRCWLIPANVALGHTRIEFSYNEISQSNRHTGINKWHQYLLNG